MALCGLVDVLVDKAVIVTDSGNKGIILVCNDILGNDFFNVHCKGAAPVDSCV